MKSKLEPGQQRVMHTRSGPLGRDEVVLVTLGKQGADVIWPRAVGMFEAITAADGPPIPEPLIARDGSGWLTLHEGWSIGRSVSSLGHAEHRIQYATAVATGARGVAYAAVNGMTSMVDGLAKWTRRTPVTTKVNFDESSSGIAGLSVHAANLDPLQLGGPLSLELTTSYSHSPEPKGGVYSISTALEVRTRSAGTDAWMTHARVHRMIQDLMCLAYGRPCLSTIRAVMREDDQEFEAKDDRRFWHHAYQPSFGRTARSVEGLTDQDEPLFYFEEADPSRVAAWLSEYELWSRPTWIGVTPFFHPDLPVETRLLQVAVALEALAAAIAQRAKTPEPKNFVPGLKVVLDSLGFEPDAVVGSMTSDEWCEAFNAAYKGVKHADNPLPDPVDAFHRAKEGIALIRCWLAVELGVSVSTLEKALAKHRI